MTTDILIPIFNGLDHVRACIESVRAHTPSTVDIYLGDDASTDDEIAPFLERISEEDERIHVVSHPENLGFVGNVNDLLMRTTKDVIVLNSDTIVTAGWFERILEAASASPRIGSVTPLSNNAEIASVPEMVTANSYPSAVDTAELGEIADSVGSGRIIEIPTAVGFCMWLRRDALDDVGGFDESSFGKGYGEENDLSLRMRANGWLNVLCDRVFVQHVGAVSFASAGTGRLRENLQTLDGMWPTYHKTIARFIRTNPLRGVQARFGVELLRRTKSDRRRVLYLLHNPLVGKAIGGTEFQTADLISGLGESIEPIVLFPAERGLDIQWVHDSGMLRFPAAANHEETYEDLWIDRLLDTGVDVIHCQHAMRFALPELEAIIAAARRRDIPIVWSLHDYYVLCPQAQLLDAETGVPCVSLDNTGRCHGCENRADELANCDVAEWRSTFAGWLSQASAVLSPSDAASHLIEATFPGVTPSVISHGMDVSAIPASSSAPASFRLGILGYAGLHKGDRQIVPLIEALEDSDIEWHLFGRVEKPEGLSAAAQDRVHLHGRYQRGTLPRLLREAEISATVLLSPWPETYSYTLSETWLAGIPAFGSNQGAIAERINTTGAGVVFPSNDPQAMARIIEETLSNGELMIAMQKSAHAAAVELPTIAAMAESYANIYESASTLRSPSDIPAPVVLSVRELVDLIAAVRVIEPAG